MRKAGFAVSDIASAVGMLRSLVAAEPITADAAPLAGRFTIGQPVGRTTKD